MTVGMTISSKVYPKTLKLLKHQQEECIIYKCNLYAQMGLF